MEQRNEIQSLHFKVTPACTRKVEVRKVVKESENIFKVGGSESHRHFLDDIATQAREKQADIWDSKQQGPLNQYGLETTTEPESKLSPDMSRKGLAQFKVSSKSGRSLFDKVPLCKPASKETKPRFASTSTTIQRATSGFVIGVQSKILSKTKQPKPSNSSEPYIPSTNIQIHQVSFLSTLSKPEAIQIPHIAASLEHPRERLKSLRRSKQLSIAPGRLDKQMVPSFLDRMLAERVLIQTTHKLTAAKHLHHERHASGPSLHFRPWTKTASNSIITKNINTRNPTKQLLRVAKKHLSTGFAAFDSWISPQL